MEPNQTLRWTETLRPPVQEARRALEEVGKEARHALGEIGHAIAPARLSLEQSIVAHPMRAVALSIAAGVFLGWLIKRS